MNPLREPGLERYWVPSNVESALFGTQMTDEFFPVHTGGDVAFLNGVLKVLLEEGGVDERLRRASTRPASTSCVELRSTPVARRARRGGAASSSDDMARFAQHVRGGGAAVLVWSMGITQHVQRLRQRARDRQPRLARGNVGRPGRGPDADPRPLRRAGRRRDGRLRHRLPRRRARRRRVGARRSAAQYGFPVRAERGPHRRRRWSRRPGAASSTCSSRAAATSSTCCPTPTPVASALGAGAAARAPGHRRVSPDARRSRRGRCVLLPGGDPLRAARRRHRDHHRAARRVQPGDPRARASARRAPSGRSSSTSPGAVDPERARPASASTTAQAIREEIARVVPFYDGIEHLRDDRRRRSSGAASASAKAGSSRRPTARPTSTSVAPREPEPAARAASCSRPGAASSSTRWSGKQRDPLTGADRDALFMAEPRTPRALGLARRRRRPRALRHRRDPGARPPRAAARAATCRCSSPRRTRSSRAGRRDPVALVPDYNAVVEVIASGAQRRQR